MMVTVFASVAVYYECTINRGLPDAVGITCGVTTAVLLSAFFTRLKRNKRHKK